MAENYRRFIDSMVELALISVKANRIRANGHAERTNDGLWSRISGSMALSEEEAKRKSIMLSLTAEQRSAVIDLIIETRIGAIHDVIVDLDALDVRLDGKSFFELSDEEPKFDFLSRLEGEPW